MSNFLSNKSSSLKVGTVESAVMSTNYPTLRYLPVFLQIMVHTPEDFPDISSSYKVYSELNQSSRISVSVSHIRADESLNRLEEKDRKCFLYEERTTRTKNFPTSRSNAEDNCYSECRLRNTYKMCNCTPYYFDMEGKIQ